MELKEFSDKMKELSEKISIELNDIQVNKFYEYMNILLKWNERMNLTAITDPDEVIVKHFIDSITINNSFDNNKKIIDVGTGAGFPGIPLGIIRPDLNILLVDSLNKRINFLENVCTNLKIDNAKTLHARVEELGKNAKFREKFDYASSRAVAPLNVLLEYMLPFVKVGGYCVCMKGSNVIEEINTSEKALEILGGKIERIEEFTLPLTDIKRNIVLVKKIKNTPAKFPRKPGTPSKEPIE